MFLLWKYNYIDIFLLLVTFVFYVIDINGTLFLDEISNLDYEVQGYLLRGLQEKKIRRIGGVQDMPVNTRIIVASNENPATAVKEGKFREDLYHRLNEFEITVPPLRSRTEDLSLFVDQFVAETNIELDKKVYSPEKDTISILARYSWPGNIRELKNAIRRACLLCPDGGRIGAIHLPSEIVYFEEDIQIAVNEKSPLIIRQKKPREITLSEIHDALKMNNYNKTKAAHFLGIDRKTLYSRIKNEQL